MLLFVGYGNPLRGDDGLGPAVVHQLAQRVQRAGVQFVTCHQLTPELVETISQSCHVVFIDAFVGGCPGEIWCNSIEPSMSPGALNHYVSPAMLLAAARSWYGAKTTGTLITISGASFGFSEQLSSPVEAALRQVLEWLEQGIDYYFRVYGLAA
ncbi:MAG: hydrogenase maturation protease [Chloroflexi bacterium]|nr:hydrogenase maturation protease [Chloroflexota bacterium]